jgi:hypothetical protein
MDGRRAEPGALESYAVSNRMDLSALTPERIRGRRRIRRGTRLPAAALLLLAASPLPASSWIIPGVANTPGVNGVTFLSDLTAVNPSGFSVSVTLSLVPAPGLPDQDSRTFVIAGAAALHLTNVLGTVWATAGTGALRVTADRPVGLFARTYAVPSVVTIPEATRPTFGTALPVVEEGALLQAGETGHSPWATQSPDVGSGDRTNVAVAFPGDAGGTATVTLYDDRGRTLGSATFDSPRPAFLQRSLATFSTTGVAAGRITISVLRGSACGYTATADAGTGDLTVIATDRLPARFHAMMSNGVAQLPGSNGAFWQTEARLANPGTTAVSVTAFLLGGPGSSPQGFLSVPAGGTVAIASLVTSLFGVSDAVAGEVLWVTDGPLLIATRTSSLVSLPLVSGSAGEGRAAVPIAAFLSAEDSPAEIGDVRSDLFSRSNLFIAAGPQGASYALEARDETGRGLGSYRGTLPPLGWAEFRVSDLFPEPGGRLIVRVSVLSGTVSVQAGVVDSAANDLILYEATPRAAISADPPLPAGVWGSPDGTEGITADASSILVEKFCRSGVFDQPARLDALGQFTVMGRFVENVGPALVVAAILTGQTDGRTVTFSIADISGSLVESPATYTFGKPYKILPGPCPVEY